MALLQISEPGMSTAPHQHRLAVAGRDLAERAEAARALADCWTSSVLPLPKTAAAAKPTRKPNKQTVNALA